MDIFAHTLWTAAVAKKANKNKKLIENNKKPLKVVWAAFWGIAPDLFAFGFPFIAGLYFIVTGKISISSFGSHHGLDLPDGAKWIAELPHYLYQISHSLVIFSVVFLVIWVIRKRLSLKNPQLSGGPYYEMMGWLLHILIDIPSHSAAFYPTPFLWPISDYRFLSGVSWSNPTYMVINYSLLAVVWTVIIIKYFKKKKYLQI